MIITLEKNAILFTLQSDSIHLNPLIHFVNNSFNSVKHLSSSIIVFSKEKEKFKKKYLLRWAYKIYKMTAPQANSSFLQTLIESYNMPICVRTIDTKSITKTAVITIKQIDTFDISISVSQHHNHFFRYFNAVFKDSLIYCSNTKSFKVRIRTKSDLSLLKNILSSNNIASIPVRFVTHGLNFYRLHQEEVDSEENRYKEKLKKSYKVLSISRGTTVKEMKKNYRNMLKKYHPDIVYNQNNDLVQLYTKRFQAIQNAYSFVKEHHKIS